MNEERFDFIAYLNKGDIDLLHYQSFIGGSVKLFSLVLEAGNLQITQTGKIMTTGSFKNILKLIDRINKVSTEKIAIIAYSQRIENDEFQVFCPNLDLGTEVISREIREIIYELGGDGSHVEMPMNLANELISKLFFEEGISSSMIDEQWNGIIMISAPIKRAILKELSKLPEKTSVSGGDVGTLPINSKLKERLIDLGIGILASLIAWGIAELIIRFVISKPHAAPHLSEHSVKDLGIYEILEDKQPKRALDIARITGLSEHVLISQINSISAIQKIDPVERTFVLSDSSYVAPDACYVSDSSERLASLSYLDILAKITGFQKPRLISNGSYLRLQSNLVPRSRELGSFIETSKSSAYEADEQVVHSIVRQNANYLY